MKFDKGKYVIEKMTLDGETIRFRAFRNLIYVEHPVCPEYQKMNIYVPEAYYEGKSINGYDLKTAPVFMPNQVGGYMPGIAEEPGYTTWGKKRHNSIFCALQHGYVVAAPAIRGRVQQDENGIYIGKAPACIVDYKAAVRYLHFFSDDLPGDENKIITNGTSAGGALSALMGATGNHPDYESYLEKLGAADAPDHIFAASCYCPITNLEHADMAYEWQFLGVQEYHCVAMRLGKDGNPFFSKEDGSLTQKQIEISSEEAKLFPEYVNGLDLRDEAGKPLTLDYDGNGSLKELVKCIILESAQKAIDCGIGIADKKWLSVKAGKAVDMDFAGYVKDITRMKIPPAFDTLTLESPENSLFGNSETDCCHFTKYSHSHSEVHGGMAEASVIKMMNPMNYIDEPKADTAKYWRIRHGECDRDTSLAVSVILAVKLKNAGCHVDYHAPWNTPHSGDYDLNELVAWIDEICK